MKMKAERINPLIQAVRRQLDLNRPAGGGPASDREE